MRKSLSLLLLLTVVGALAVVVAAPASAAIHPIAESECAAQDSEGGGGQHQNPPGQINNPSAIDDHTVDEDGHDGSKHHPFQNANGNARNGEGSEHCANPGHDGHDE